MKRRELARVKPAVELDPMRALKAALDPRGTSIPESSCEAGKRLTRSIDGGAIATIRAQCLRLTAPPHA
jgi:hypothetical protein